MYSIIHQIFLQVFAFVVVENESSYEFNHLTDFLFSCFVSRYMNLKIRKKKIEYDDAD